MLGLIGAAAVAGAVANAANGWADADGMSVFEVVEIVLSDGAIGAGVALTGMLLVYTSAWWLYRGVGIVRVGAR